MHLNFRCDTDLSDIKTFFYRRIFDLSSDEVDHVNVTVLRTVSFLLKMMKGDSELKVSMAKG